MGAVKADDRSLVKRLLAEGASVDAADAAGDRPLIIAAYLGHTEVLELLLAAGADLTVVDPGMRATALHAAAYAGRTEAAGVLIDHGIAINQQGPINGYTALHDAVWQNHGATVRVILAGGADPTIRSRDGQTPLDLARAQGHRELAGLLETVIRPV
ncbi:MAG: ankyrin repeat domain-containing protein [Cyanobacteriota bacterium]